MYMTHFQVISKFCIIAQQKTYPLMICTVHFRGNTSLNFCIVYVLEINLKRQGQKRINVHLSIFNPFFCGPCLAKVYQG